MRILIGKKDSYFVLFVQQLTKLAFIVCLFFACKNKNAKTSTNHHFEALTLKAQALDSTLCLAHFEVDSLPTSLMPIPNKVAQKSQALIEQRYFELGGDAAQTYFKPKDLFVTLLSHPIKTQYIVYLLILKNPVDEKVSIHCIGYNSLQDQIQNDYLIDFGASYTFRNGRFQAANLIQKYMPKNCIEFNHQAHIKLSKLVHNGTYNAQQTLILALDSEKLDTIFFEEKRFK